MFGAVKTILGIAVSIGSTVIVKGAIQQVTPENLGRIKRICVPFASVAISGAVSKAAMNYTDKFVDDMAEITTKIGAVSEEYSKISESKKSSN